MHNLAIIGAGQLGSRHLQGLHYSKNEYVVHLVDPDPASIKIARERFQQISGNNSNITITSYSSTAELPSNIDLAIIATNSDVRLSIIRMLLELTNVNFLILEKVLFSREEEFSIALELIKNRKIKAWVNCNRRLWALYQNIKSEFRGKYISRIDYGGGAWGLACNGIHIIDLCQFLSGEVPTCFNVGSLYPGFTQSKRYGFMEFGGLISGNTSTKLSISLQSQVSSTMSPLLIIESEDVRYVIDERRKKYFRFTDEKVEENSFSVPLQSEMTGPLVDEILTIGTCLLPTLTDSTIAHIPFLRALNKHLTSHSITAASGLVIT